MWQKRILIGMGNNVVRKNEKKMIRLLWTKWVRSEAIYDSEWEKWRINSLHVFLDIHKDLEIFVKEFLISGVWLVYNFFFLVRTYKYHEIILFKGKLDI